MFTWSFGCTGCHVHVVVRVHGLLGSNFTAQDQVGAVRQDFVGVHVGGRSGARLEDVQHEMRVELAVHQLLGRLLDRPGPFGIEQSEVLVHLGRGPLDHSHRVEEAAIETKPADRKIQARPFGLRPVQHVRGNADGTH